MQRKAAGTLFTGNTGNFWHDATIKNHYSRDLWIFLEGYLNENICFS
jgi:hypothetical protein